MLLDATNADEDDAILPNPFLAAPTTVVVMPSKNRYQSCWGGGVVAARTIMERAEVLVGHSFVKHG